MNFWLGITDEGENGVWRNVYTGEPLNFVAKFTEPLEEDLIYAFYTKTGEWEESLDSRSLVCVYDLTGKFGNKFLKAQ